MDLSTVLSKIDLHRYGTVKEFLQDVDLIWQNALEYNPDRDPSGTHTVASSNTGDEGTGTLVGWFGLVWFGLFHTVVFWV